MLRVSPRSGRRQSVPRDGHSLSLRSRDCDAFGRPEPTRKLKRTRWASASSNVAAQLTNLPLTILSPMTSEQVEAYALHFRVQEISQKLRIGDFGFGDRFPSNALNYRSHACRSPSPAPEYTRSGRWINTREQRHRQRLVSEQQGLIEKAMNTSSNYHPPSDYRPPRKAQEKIYIPVRDYPELNFSECSRLLSPVHFPS
jgi:splicing factor 1